MGVDMEIFPDARLNTKGYYTLLTLSGVFVICGVILHFVVPLNPKVIAGEARFYIWTITGGVIALLWLISVPIMRLWIRNLVYHIEDERITIHKGILTKIQQNIPYRAITDFQLHRTLYDRVLGIGSLRVQTAGQSQQPGGYEGKLSGLTDWSSLLETLQSRVKEFHGKSDHAPKDSSVSTSDVLIELLEEVKAIHRRLDNPT